MRTPAIAAALLIAASLAPRPAAALEWYQGGDLHGATVAQWHAADARNRLATAADMTTATLGVDRLKAAGGWSAARKYSTDLVTCIDKGTAGIPSIAQQDVASYAAMCAAMMGWLK